MIKFKKEILEALNLPKKKFDKSNPIIINSEATDNNGNIYIAKIVVGDYKPEPVIIFYQVMPKEQIDRIINSVGFEKFKEKYSDGLTRTPGSYYVSTFMGRDGYGGGIDDKLTIDGGSNWTLIGMNKIREEILKLEKSGLLPIEGETLSEALNLPKQKQDGTPIYTGNSLKNPIIYINDYQLQKLQDYDKIYNSDGKWLSDLQLDQFRKYLKHMNLLGEALNLAKKHKSPFEMLVNKYKVQGRRVTKYGYEWEFPLEAANELTANGYDWFTKERVTNKQHPEFGKNYLTISMYHGPDSGLENLISEGLNLTNPTTFDVGDRVKMKQSKTNNGDDLVYVVFKVNEDGTLSITNHAKSVTLDVDPSDLDLVEINPIINECWNKLKEITKTLKLV